ncbi:MAG: ATP-dependent DNA helicase DinG [Brochothrix thermosphacta]|uniref:ATP-dependent DNA helicase DinG n=1 Tax=Brochothrix thermosphacta TaxID=2756 RepID=UPI003F92EAC6
MIHIARYVVVDIETTGHRPNEGDRIIEFSAIVIEHGEIVHEFSTLVNPDRTIPPFITELTKINSKKVATAPYIEDIMTIIASLLSDSVFVAHNVQFDWPFIQSEAKRLGYDFDIARVIDTVELTRILFPTLDSYRLSDLSEDFNITHDQPHSAASDTLATVHLFLEAMQALDKVPTSVLEQLYELMPHLLSDFSKEIYTLIQKKERRNEPLSKSLVAFEGLIFRRPIETEILNKTVEDVSYPHTMAEKENLIQQSFSNYEPRPNQFVMMDQIYDQLRLDHHQAIEAGTGIGKTLGYLLPAAYFSQESGKRVVVATYSLLLQNQMMAQDVPRLQKLLPFPTKVATVKGRTHYVSLNKLSVVLKAPGNNYDEFLTKAQLLIWLLQTNSGDMTELNHPGGGKNIMYQVTSSARDDGSIFEEYEYYSRMKREAAAANIVVTTHATLWLDTVSQTDVLGDYDHVIVDEAHHLTDSARQFLGAQFSLQQTRYMLNRITSLHKENTWSEMKKKSDLADSLFEIGLTVTSLDMELGHFFTYINELFLNEKEKRPGAFRVALSDGEKVTVAQLPDHIVVSYRRCENFYKVLSEQLLEMSTAKSVSEEALFEIEVTRAISFIKEQQQALVRLMTETEPEMVVWYETDRKNTRNGSRLVGEPLQTAPLIQERLFQTNKSVILTSATLTTDRSFDYLEKELGFETSALPTLALAASFDYATHVRLCLPEDMPSVKQVSVNEYAHALADYLSDVAQVTDGRMLVLFTAYDMLTATYHRLNKDKKLDAYRVLAQNVTSGSTQRLIQQFKRTDKAILLGTTSFWEGLDIPGEALSCIAIVRLPFISPEDPYMKAQMRRFKEQGENAFEKYALPQAILRFRQGFGRLMRHENDRGIILVFDQRIDNTDFGQAFLHSIPSVDIVKGTSEVILPAIAEWLPQTTIIDH